MSKEPYGSIFICEDIATNLDRSGGNGRVCDYLMISVSSSLHSLGAFMDMKRKMMKI